VLITLLFVVMQSNYRLRMVNTRGMISTIAGTGARTVIPANGPAGQVGVTPWSVAVDSKEGVFYIADRTTVRKMVRGASAVP
jgi:LDH2 family malate/lactate/ureidoglycolate dehydrogenase